MKQLDQSLRLFIEKAGSASPTPGGGSIAALVAALGASMTSMVGHLTQGDKFLEQEHTMQKIISNMKQLSHTCEQILEDDITIFNQYIAALKLPKSSIVEKQARASALENATIRAIDVPLRLMEVCKLGLIYTTAIVNSANKVVISDLGIGALLFEASAQSALLTIQINLATLKNEELKQKYSVLSQTLIDEISQMKTEALSTISKIISQ